MAQSGSLSAETKTLNHVLSLVKAFRAFDADKDGCIAAAELGGILGSLGYNASEQDVRAMMQRGDTNKDGLLSMEEFIVVNTKDMEVGSLANFLKRLKSAIEAFNVDGHETITTEELHKVMGNLGILSLEEWCEGFIASLDGDGDGVVSLQDFKLLVTSLL